MMTSQSVLTPTAQLMPRLHCHLIIFALALLTHVFLHACYQLYLTSQRQFSMTLTVCWAPQGLLSPRTTNVNVHVMKTIEAAQMQAVEPGNEAEVVQAAVEVEIVQQVDIAQQAHIDRVSGTLPLYVHLDGHIQ